MENTQMSEPMTDWRREEIRELIVDNLERADVCPRGTCYAPAVGQLARAGDSLLAELERVEAERVRAKGLTEALEWYAEVSSHANCCGPFHYDVYQGEIGPGSRARAALSARAHDKGTEA